MYFLNIPESLCPYYTNFSERSIAELKTFLKLSAGFEMHTHGASWDNK